MGGILKSGLWSHFPDEKLIINSSKAYKLTLDLDKIPLNENVSDACVSQMLDKCLITDFCWRIMTSFGYQDYPLSHQVFYWEMTKRVSYVNHFTRDEARTFCQIL